MIKLCLDENINPHLAPLLRQVFKRVGFTSVKELDAIGAEDLELFSLLAGEKVDGLVTLDMMQLIRPAERAGLREAGLHWIGLPMPDGRGFQVHSQNSGALIAGLAAILEDGFAAVPHQYRVEPVPRPKRARYSAMSL